MELVAGEDLSQRIVRGAIRLDEALPIAKQIAEALEAAHEQGIIHRDLKPANIKVRPDGTVKVLDFGLAKAMDAGRQRVRRVAVADDHDAGDDDGRRVILGTAAYMSPEQARGKAVDKRTDIWAFGCVLFEMLSGRSAFAGETVSDTIVAILEREPDWNALPDATPSAVRRLLQRCLEKDPGGACMISPMCASRSRTRSQRRLPANPRDPASHVASSGLGHRVLLRGRSSGPPPPWRWPSR